jgi:CubicO group peptidase (beta-lactamase class C family)
MILVTLLAISFSAAAVDPAVIDRLAQESMKAWSAPGVAVAIVGPDGILYSKGYGVKRLGSADPVTSKTIFAIGSTTKAFTVAALGTLVDQGRLNWDDPVRKHLPEFRLADPSATELVTIRDLVSHRTGLSRNDSLWYGSPWSREEILDRISRVALTKPFRSAWQYQNIMFLAAGQAAARTAGAIDWEELVQRRIFDPLGMKDTCFHPPAADDAGNAFAAPHAKRGGKVQVIPWRNIDNIGPAGSINSNVEDLAKWVQVHLNEGKPILEPATLLEMHTPQMAMRREEWGRNYTDETNQMTYGLGWFLQDFRGIHTVNHGGAIDGFRAQITLLPKQKQAVIVLANLGEDNMPEALRWKIVDHLVAAPAGRDWDRFLIERGERAAAATRISPKRVEGTKPSLPLSAYVGDFREPAYGIARVTQTSKGLELAWSSSRVALEHHHYDTFVSKDPRFSGLVNFGLDAAGNVSRVSFQGVEFYRMPPPLDPAKVGQLFVGALKLAQGEKVIVRFDPDYHQELTAPIEKAIRDAGGVVAASLPYVAKGTAAATADCPAFNRLLADTTVYLWMPLREETREVTPCETQSLVKWLDAGGAHREIHFHWNGGSVLADGLVTDHQPEFDSIYAAALNVDYAGISRDQDRAIQALRSGTVRVHTPAGTDITFKVGERPFNKQDGDASAERMKQAKVRVDREIELPAGVLRVAPLEETANGIIVVPEARFGSSVARNVRLTVQAGRVVQITASSGKEAVEAVLNQGGDAARKFREFGLGFNPRLIAPKGSRILPYFAYGTGMVRMSLGDNEEIGGSVRGGAYRRWFFFPDATVEVEGKVISRPGNILLQ